MTHLSAVPATEMEPECPNCKRKISHNFTNHVRFCERNNTLCPKCNEPVLKNDLENHLKDDHKHVFSF
ncbi:hypothetical protein BLNAU_20135 [Blattamonas nauphoetae]|uniref:Uncharacterized protein n=1 Tax=Blattamonas nauphoetae TaxID=2049346 RepID=A0ABQ9WZL5_9EUKA|nr:hypothetical protein BLNAU_20135 [Blattamonas nauphoetae]